MTNLNCAFKLRLESDVFGDQFLDSQIKLIKHLSRINQLLINTHPDFRPKVQKAFDDTYKEIRQNRLLYEHYNKNQKT